MPLFKHGQRQLFYREQGSGPLLLILLGNTAVLGVTFSLILILSKLRLLVGRPG
jgi:hypothetical protein